MKRAFAVVLVAILTAFVSGVHESPSWASQADGSPARDARAPDEALTRQSDARAQRMAARVARIQSGKVVKVERQTGPTIQGVLEEVTADAIVVIVPAQPTSRRETIAFDEITDISEVKGHALRTFLIGVGVGVAVLVGVCAAAANAERTPAATSLEEPPLR